MEVLLECRIGYGLDLVLHRLNLQLQQAGHMSVQSGLKLQTCCSISCLHLLLQCQIGYGLHLVCARPGLHRLSFQLQEALQLSVLSTFRTASLLQQLTD